MKLWQLKMIFEHEEQAVLKKRKFEELEKVCDFFDSYLGRLMIRDEDEDEVDVDDLVKSLKDDVKKYIDDDDFVIFMAIIHTIVEIKEDSK